MSAVVHSLYSCYSERALAGTFTLSFRPERSDPQSGALREVEGLWVMAHQTSVRSGVNPPTTATAATTVPPLPPRSR